MSIRFRFIPIHCDTCNLDRAEDEDLDEWWVIHQDHKGHLLPTINEGKA